MALLYMCCYPSPKRIGLYAYQVCVLSLVGGLNRSEYAIGNLGGGVSADIIRPTPFISKHPNVKAGFHMAAFNRSSQFPFFSSKKWGDTDAPVVHDF